ARRDHGGSEGVHRAIDRPRHLPSPDHPVVGSSLCREPGRTLQRRVDRIAQGGPSGLLTAGADTPSLRQPVFVDGTSNTLQGIKEIVMGNRFSGSIIAAAIAAAAASVVISVSVTRTSAQAPAVSGSALKTPWGEPDLQGIWTD